MYKQVSILATSQALFQTIIIIVMTIGGLAGAHIAQHSIFSTVPIAAMFLGTTIMMFPASLLMERIGRKNGFLWGACFGLIGGLICAIGIYINSLIILSVGTFIIGAYQSFAQYYRFAASEIASDSFRSRAISLVLAGGVIAALIGPTLIEKSSKFLKYQYMGSFLLVSIIALIALIILGQLKLKSSVIIHHKEVARHWSKILLQPSYFVALFCAATGYGVMVLGMTATPIAMQQADHGLKSISTVIQFHVLGMFLPSFITGILISRFGVLKIMFSGILLLSIYIFIAVWSSVVLSFIFALILLGVGWNFLFIGGTVLLTQTYSPAEKSKALAMNDMIIFIVGICCSFGAGVLVNLLGWETMNLLLVGWLTLAAVSIIWLYKKQYLPYITTN